MTFLQKRKEYENKKRFAKKNYTNRFAIFDSIFCNEAFRKKCKRGVCISTFVVVQSFFFVSNK